MIKFELISKAQALENIHDELNSYTIAATILVDRFHFFVDWFHEIEGFLEFVELPETTENDCPGIAENFFHDTISIIERLPGLIVCNPEANWSNMVNSLITLLNEYIGYQDTISKAHNDEDQSIKVSQLHNHLQRLVQIIQCGTTVEDLLAIMAQLIERIEHLNSNQPMTFQLSKMYLDAMNFQGNEEYTI